jgi:DNA-binding MarR family transcriptional regulator
MDPTERFRSALTAASRGYKAAAAERMRTVGVHTGQNFLLDALDAHGELTTGEIARELRVEVPTVTKMVQRMEAAGMVERRSDPEDRRRVRVSLTAEGKRAAQAVPRLLDEVTAASLRGFSAADRDQLTALLERLADNLDSHRRSG